MKARAAHFKPPEMQFFSSFSCPRPAISRPSLSFCFRRAGLVSLPVHGRNFTLSTYRAICPLWLPRTPTGGLATDHRYFSTPFLLLSFFLVES